MDGTKSSTGKYENGNNIQWFQLAEVNIYYHFPTTFAHVLQ